MLLALTHRVEHPNFEFSLSLDIRRDPHILKALHEKSNPAATSARGASTTRPTARPTSLLLPSKHDAPGSPVRGLRALFHSPRKARTKPSDERGSRSSTPLPPQPLPQPGRSQPRESIAKYLIDDRSSTLAKTHIAFGPIAKNCQAKILEMRYPMFAMFKASASSAAAAGGNGGTSGGEEKRPLVAKITLQLFRLPPLPGIKAEDMPQCIDEALRGMRHHAWHEHEYHEGVLTQDGGDCSVSGRVGSYQSFSRIWHLCLEFNVRIASLDTRSGCPLFDCCLRLGFTCYAPPWLSKPLCFCFFLVPLFHLRLRFHHLDSQSAQTC